MALNSRSSVDPRWMTYNRAVGYGLQLATVEVYNQASGNQVYNAETNSFTGTMTSLYIGPARVQPINTVSETSDTYNPTFLKTVRIQLPYNKNTVQGSNGEMPDIRPNDRVRVTASSFDTTLEKFVFMVTDVLNSSNSWERTLVCRVDTELDPTVN